MELVRIDSQVTLPRRYGTDVLLCSRFKVSFLFSTVTSNIFSIRTLSDDGPIPVPTCRASDVREGRRATFEASRSGAFEYVVGREAGRWWEDRFVSPSPSFLSEDMCLPCGLRVRCRAAMIRGRIDQGCPVCHRRDEGERT